MEKDVIVRLQKGGTVYQMWRRRVFRNCSLSKDTKLRPFQTLVMPVLLYGAETWNVSKHDLRKLHTVKTFQMRCLHDILGVTLWDRVWNTTILERTREPPVEDQLWLRILQWFAHVLRMQAHRHQWQAVRCRPGGIKRPPGGAPMRWCDLQWWLTGHN